MSDQKELLEAVKQTVSNEVKEVAEKTAKVVEVAEKNADSISKLAEAVEENKEEMKSLKASKVSSEKETMFKESFEAKKAELKSLKEGNVRNVNMAFKADVTYSDLTHDNELNQLGSGISDIVKKRVFLYDLFRKTPMVTETFAYLEQTSAVRDAKGTALCAKGFTSLSKEEIGVQRVNYVKLKDTVDICKDYADDFGFVENRYRTLLADSMAFKIETELLLGTNTSTSTNSIDNVSSEFSATNADAPIGATIQDANYVDLLLSMATQIDVLGQQASFSANVALVNKLDWFKFVESKKDANNNYLDYRVRSVNGMIVVGDLVILPLVDVPANSVYVMDTTRGEILDRRSVEMTMSAENGTNFVDDFVTMMITAKMQFLVKSNDSNAFMKCSDVATAITAITAP